MDDQRRIDRGLLDAASLGPRCCRLGAGGDDGHHLAAGADATSVPVQLRWMPGRVPMYRPERQNFEVRLVGMDGLLHSGDDIPLDPELTSIIRWGQPGDRSPVLC